MITNWINYFKTLFKSKKGQGMVEYGLIIGVVAVMLIAALVLLREQLSTLFTSIANYLGGNVSMPSGT
jgi:pilus assembly protein Flp/PilA